ncbi:MAG: glycosyltransferase family 1 protein [Actinomycetota bacterium]
MKIGIYFTPNKDQGGTYSYDVSFLEALSRIRNNNYVIFNSSKDLPKKFSSISNFKVININMKDYSFLIKIRELLSHFIAIIFPSFVNILYKLNFFDLITSIYKITQTDLIKIFENENLDLIFYPTSSNLSFLVNAPFMVTVHDLQHRQNSKFKEVSAGGRWENREYSFKNISENAFRIFVDSEIGKKDLINYYKSNPAKIVILPYLASTYLNTKLPNKKVDKLIKDMKLPESFIFYPAKFWPHKNHVNLIKALKILKDQKKNVNLVLTGSKHADYSSYNEVFDLIKKYNLGGQVYYLGHVDPEQLSAIYKKSQAMVMPTFFGPTNIPILEAWVMGTSVVTSDIRGCRDQLGNAGLLVNPNSPRDIAQKTWKLYTNKKLRLELVRRGKIKIDGWKLSDFTLTIEKVILDFKTGKINERGNN